MWNPCTGAVLRRTPESELDEVRAATAAASAALPSWAETPITQRARILFELRERVNGRVDALAACVSEELGKTRADARGDVIRGLEVLEYATSVVSHLQGNLTMGIARDGLDIAQVREPLGVCVGLAPFNFPAMLPLWMFPMALACGNTFVLKPSQRVPGASMLLAELATEAGVPPGVLNVVHGGQAASEALLDDPAVAAVSFVGSTAAGRAVYQRATQRGIRAQCNLGAKNHACILPDAPQPTAVAEQLVGAAFGASGQRCMAISAVVLVGDGAFRSRMMRYLHDAAQRLRVGPPEDERADLGPLASPTAKQRVLRLIERAQQAGARLVLDGRATQAPTATDDDDAAAKYAGGFWLGPTLLDNVRPDMEIYREEVFGPVLVCLQAESLDEAIALVNGNAYGNGCAVYTSSGACAHEFVRRVQVGQVGVNMPIPVPLPAYGFTGSKASMMGDLHFYGRAGFEFFSRPKTIMSRWSLKSDTAARRAQVLQAPATAMPSFSASDKAG